MAVAACGETRAICARCAPPKRPAPSGWKVAEHAGWARRAPRGRPGDQRSGGPRQPPLVVLEPVIVACRCTTMCPTRAVRAPSALASLSSSQGSARPPENERRSVHRAQHLHAQRARASHAPSAIAHARCDAAALDPQPHQIRRGAARGAIGGGDERPQAASRRPAPPLPVGWCRGRPLPASTAPAPPTRGPRHRPRPGEPRPRQSRAAPRRGGGGASSPAAARTPSAIVASARAGSVQRAAHHRRRRRPRGRAASAAPPPPPPRRRSRPPPARRR